MSSDDFPTPGWEERFPEPLKFLPVAFIVAMIVGLYSIYVTFHLKPRMEDPGTSGSAYFDACIFHLVTFMLVFCYVLCVFVHPGTIPDKEEDPSWEYDEAEGPQPIAADLLLNMQEMKRSGDRRHCKWCLKYKPDRCHHCRVCRICILKMDHHCPWIYNCVGFRNYKYFFLLLLYTSIDCAFIVFSMIPSVRAGTQPTTPFMTMFWLMFGETLAGFLGVLVFLFFCFHIYLMMKAMTTIEFCEKSHSKGSFNASTYDRGVVGNVKAVLGDDWWLWLLPTSRPPGRGVSFINEETRLSKDMEAGRGLRRRAHDRPEGPSGTTASAPKRRSDAKPNACGGTGSTGQSEEDSHSGSGSEVPDVGSSRDPRQVPNYGAAGSPKKMEAAEK